VTARGKGKEKGRFIRAQSRELVGGESRGLNRSGFAFLRGKRGNGRESVVSMCVVDKSGAGRDSGEGERGLSPTEGRG